MNPDEGRERPAPPHEPGPADLPPLPEDSPAPEPVGGLQPGMEPDETTGVGGWRVWLLAARPATLSAAVAPLLVGTAAASEAWPLRALPFVAALVASVLIQVGTNLANDYFDFRRGADAGRLGPTRVTQSGLIAPRRVLTGAYLAFGLAALVGLYLVYIGGWPILLVGIAAILAGLAYTGGPWPLGYHGLGDLFVFVFFGVVAVTGSAYLQTLGIEERALWASVAIGCLVTAILVVNNLRDVDTDRRAGKRTLAVRLGRRFSRSEYAVLVLVAYAVPLAMWLAGELGPEWWLPWITLPLGVTLIRTVVRADDGPTLNRALKETGQLHLLFGMFFAASLWISGAPL